MPTAPAFGRTIATNTAWRWWSAVMGACNALTKDGPSARRSDSVFPHALTSRRARNYASPGNPRPPRSRPRCKADRTAWAEREAGRQARQAEALAIAREAAGEIVKAAVGEVIQRMYRLGHLFLGVRGQHWLKAELSRYFAKGEPVPE